MLLGATEVIPCALLLFPRTKVLGAVLMLPPALGVCLVNFALRLWPETRVISAVLLGLNVIVLLGEQAVIRGALRVLLGPPGEKTRWRRVDAVVGSVLLVGGAAGYTLLLQAQIAAQVGSIADFIGERQINGAGAWSVESVSVGDDAVASPRTRVSFDFDRHCLVESMSGDDLAWRERRSEVRRQCTYTADRANHTFELHSNPGAGAGLLDDVTGTYTIAHDRLTLIGARDGKPLRIVLRPWSFRPAPRASGSGR